MPVLEIAWLTAGHPVWAASVETWQSGRTVKRKPNTLQPFTWHPVEAVQPRWGLHRPVIDAAPVLPEPIVLHGVYDGEGLVAAAGRYDTRHVRAHAVPAVTPITSRIARLVGLFLAEGHCSENKTVWSFHEDEVPLIQFVVETTRDVWGLDAHIGQPNQHAVQVTVHSKPLTDWFREMVGSNGDTVHVPHGWLDAPPEILSEVWDGAMAGDGDHAGAFANRRLTTSNPQLARDYVVVGRKLGHSVALREADSDTGCRVAVNERADEHPSARHTVTMPYTGPVCNLEVEEDHSYTVEGYAVHNCWIIGESFTKQSGHKDDFYGKLYVVRKVQEEAKNANLDFKDQAMAALTEKNWKKDTQTKAAYEEGRLPQARIHLRAQRYATKLFLSHWHHVAYRYHYGVNPPKPYVLEHLGHAHLIQVPNWPWAE